MVPGSGCYACACCQTQAGGGSSSLFFILRTANHITELKKKSPQQARRKKFKCYKMDSSVIILRPWIYLAFYLCSISVCGGKEIEVTGRSVPSFPVALRHPDPFGSLWREALNPGHRGRSCFFENEICPGVLLWKGQSCPGSSGQPWAAVLQTCSWHQWWSWRVERVQKEAAWMALVWPWQPEPTSHTAVGVLLTQDNPWCLRVMGVPTFGSLPHWSPPLLTQVVL